MSSAGRERRLELLAGRVLGDLSEAEQRELSQTNTPEEETFTWELEKTAAAVQLALAGTQSEQMPAELLQRIRKDAMNHVVQGVGGIQPESIVLPEGNASALLRHSSVIESAPRSSFRFAAREMVAWVACAAAVLVCIGLLQTGDRPAPVATAAELRETLIRDTGGSLLTVDWASGTTPFTEPVSGDVVWHNESQAGFMRFVGLPVNDATVEQYQLWIIDPGRDDEPIDGGVFDSTSSGEIVVPIVAKLKVINPQAFAITVEKPGGVVVSTQERLPLLAAVQ